MTNIDSPGVIVPPPVYVAMVIGLAFAMDFLWPLRIDYYYSLAWSGYVVVALAIVILILCARQFHVHKTDLRPHKPASRMVHAGPYRLSRNPIYLGFLMLQLGYGFVEHHIWVILTLPVSFVILHFHVIASEEAYLRRRFGDEYEQYCQAVNRWL